MKNIILGLVASLGAAVILEHIGASDFLAGWLSAIVYVIINPKPRD